MNENAVTIRYFIAIFLLSMLSTIEGFLYGKYGFIKELILLEVLNGVIVFYLMYLIYCCKTKENCYTRE